MVNDYIDLMVPIPKQSTVAEPMSETLKSIERRRIERVAAVSCSSNGARVDGVRFGFWLTGKLGRAWHGCMGGAWVHGSLVVVVVVCYMGCGALGGSLK